MAVLDATGERYSDKKSRAEFSSEYLHLALDPRMRRPAVNDAVSFLSTIDFDTVAVSGFSGTTVGSMVADRLDKALTIVRKGKDYDTEHAHSDEMVEGRNNARYVIVDDFISSGATVRRMLQMLKKHGECVGVYLWRDREWFTWADMPHKCLPDAERARRDRAERDKIDPRRCIDLERATFKTPYYVGADRGA